MKYEDARDKVFNLIKSFDCGCDRDDELILEDEKVIETDFGWVFFYNSKKCLEPGNPTLRLAGNGPIIFDNRDESIHQTGTGRPVSYYIKRHKNSYRPNKTGSLEKNLPNGWWKFIVNILKLK